MTNHMNEVAQMFNVELNEEFDIYFDAAMSRCATAMFTENGIKIINSSLLTEHEKERPSLILKWLLCGLAYIKPKAWKPAFDEEYYSIGLDGALESGFWGNNFIDSILYKLGNCYKTPEEAAIDRDKWIEFYSSDNIIKL